MHTDKTLSEKAHMKYTLEKIELTPSSNSTLFRFMVEEAGCNIINRLEKRCRNNRYIGYLELMGIILTKDIKALDKAARTGRALHLAFQLVGFTSFWSTIEDSIRYFINYDIDNGVIQKAKANRLESLLNTIQYKSF